jgi:hypothetical protein
VPALVDHIGRQVTFALHQGLIVQRLVLAADIALVATGMPVQAAAQVLRAASFNGSRGGHDLAQLGFGGESGGFGFLCHGLASFFVFDPSNRGRRKQGRGHRAGRKTPNTGATRSGANGAGRGLTDRKHRPDSANASSAGGTASRRPEQGKEATRRFSSPHPEWSHLHLDASILSS